jgi:hypothetical protein
MNIRHPHMISMALGMTHIMPELGRFSANITLQFFFPLTSGLDLGKMTNKNSNITRGNWQAPE